MPGWKSRPAPARWIGPGDAHRIALDAFRLRHERRDAGLDLLAHPLRVAVIVQIAERHHHGREPRHAAHLAGPEHAIDVHDLVGRHRLADDAAARVEDQHATRVIAEQPVRHPVAHPRRTGRPPSHGR
jgi:hypothetical protein